jgi:hypothetical protein
MRAQRPSPAPRVAGLIVGALAVVAAAAVGGLWLTGTLHFGAANSAAQGSTHGGTSRGHGPSTSPSPAVTSPSPSTPSQSPSATASNVVTASGGVAQNPAEPAVITFLRTYFTSINTRDYQQYFNLLNSSAQANVSPHWFHHGYRSTQDSSEKLRSLNTTGNGDKVAVVTFTSHQNPADSVNHSEACTNWRISMFLTPTGNSYVLDQPPPGYHASDSPCS